MIIELFGYCWGDIDGMLSADGESVRGYYAKAREGLYFYTQDFELFGFVRNDGLGPVTCGRTADHSPRFAYALSTPDAARFGCEKFSVPERNCEAKNVAQSIYSRH